MLLHNMEIHIEHTGCRDLMLFSLYISKHLLPHSLSFILLAGAPRRELLLSLPLNCVALCILPFELFSELFLLCFFYGKGRMALPLLSYSSGSLFLFSELPLYPKLTRASLSPILSCSFPLLSLFVLCSSSSFNFFSPPNLLIFLSSNFSSHHLLQLTSPHQTLHLTFLSSPLFQLIPHFSLYIIFLLPFPLLLVSSFLSFISFLSFLAVSFCCFPFFFFTIILLFILLLFFLLFFFVVHVPNN